MRKLFVSFFYTEDNNHEGFGNTILEFESNHITHHDIVELTYQVKLQHSFKKVVILNFQFLD